MAMKSGWGVEITPCVLDVDQNTWIFSELNECYIYLIFETESREQYSRNKSLLYYIYKH